MQSAPQPDTETLLKRAGGGDKLTAGQLLDRHRQKLCQMVAVRMDPRLATVNMRRQGAALHRTACVV